MRLIVYKKRFIVMATALMLIAVILTGCRIIPHSRFNVRQYVFKKYGLWNVSISKESEEKEGADVWTVVDKKNDVEFSVTDLFNLGHDGYYLTDDYEYSLVMNKSDILLDGFDEFECVDNSDNPYYPVKFEFHYKNLADLRKRCAELEEIYRRLSKMNSEVAVTYSSILDFSFKEDVNNKLPDVDLDDADISFKKSCGKNVGDEIYNEIKLYYVWHAYNYQWPVLLDDITEKDIEEMLAYEHMIHVSVVNADETEELIPDVISYRCWELTFGSLYLLLKEKGFDVTGYATHYTVLAPSGIEYEFSYDFYDGDGIYVLADGEKTFLRNYDDDFYISTEEIEEFFGLDLNVR